MIFIQDSSPQEQFCKFPRREKISPDWAPPRYIDVLDEVVIREVKGPNGILRIVQQWIRGLHPQLGRSHLGWQGQETISIRLQDLVRDESGELKVQKSRVVLDRRQLISYLDDSLARGLFGPNNTQFILPFLEGRARRLHTQETF